MTYPPVVVVDENDNEVGEAILAEVWRKGLYHRIVSIFVKDDLGRMLLQFRSTKVKLYPNCWDQAAGGHVDSGHSYEQAAANEVAEELGLQNAGLTKVATYCYNNRADDRIINQFVRVYLLHVSHDVELMPDANEVSKLQWFSPMELKSYVTRHPEKFTPGFLYELRQYFPSMLA